MNKDVGGESKRVEVGDEEREDALLAPEELVPITQTLITPTLASFFNLNSTERSAEEQEEADRPLPARALLGEQLDHGRLALAFREVDAENTCSSHELGRPQSDQKLKLGIDRPPRASPHAAPTGELEGRSCNGNFVDASVCAIAAAAEPVEDCGEVQKTVELGQSEGRKHDFIMGLEARAGCKRQMNGFDYRLDDGVDDREGYGMNQAERENSSNSGDGGGSGGGGGSARTLKRPRLVWTPQLHKRFVDAVSHLGIKNAVPKTIMQLMNVEGLTRENVASHLQKYRLYLRRVQQGNLFSNSTSKSILSPDHQLMGPVSPSSDHLFSSSTSSIRGQGDHHPHNHIIPQQMSLILQQPHHLQAAMVNTPPPPFNNSHFNPHLYNALAAESSPTQRPSWASAHVHMDHPHQSYHPGSQQTTPPSPPRRALTLFPH